MRNNFIGRKSELNKIEAFLNKKGFFSCLLYGRRRIGKSELIKNAIKDRKEFAIYYEAKQTTEQNNVEGLTELICEALRVDHIHFNGLEGLLEYLFKFSTKNDLILVIDEYSYLTKMINGLDSIFQNLIDKYKDNSKMKLIISGSFIDIMKDLLEYHNPL